MLSTLHVPGLAARRFITALFGALALMAFTLAATLIANRFWGLPPGPERFMAANGFFEHLGLAGGFLLVALHHRKDA